MGRITVSLPDDLEARLDKYAAEQGLAVSQVVARAVTALLDGTGGTPPPSPPPTSADPLARAYLEQVTAQLAAIGQTLTDVTDRVGGPLMPLPHPPPLPLPPPPWRTEE